MIFKILFFHHIRYYNHFWNSICTINWTPLIYASYQGHLEIVDLLLSQPGIEINCKSISIQNIHTIHLIFSLYSNLIFSLDSNLIFSLDSNLIFSLYSNLFFSYNSNLIFEWNSNLIFAWNSFFNYFWNLISSFNSTPLIVASSKGHTEIVQLLLSRPGIEINCKDILIHEYS